MAGNEGLRQQLTNYFAQMRQKNPGYSLRAMARVFKTSPAQLSQVLSGKRPMSRKFVLSVSDRLGLSPLETKEALESQCPSPRSKISFESIAEDQFKLIADWHHFAILSLGETADAKADPKWISKRLGLDYYVVREALTRLQKLGIIEIKNGRYRQITKPIHTTQDIPSAAIRKNHRQNLALASEKLEQVDVADREFTSMTMAISRKKIDLAKKMIRKFKTEMYEFLQAGAKEEVYTLAIQLFPVSKIEQEQESQGGKK
ncbi:MAG: TIGR02147 family protein [Bdellovibrionales bacterium]